MLKKYLNWSNSTIGKKLKAVYLWLLIRLFGMPLMTKLKLLNLMLRIYISKPVRLRYALNFTYIFHAVSHKCLRIRVRCCHFFWYSKASFVHYLLFRALPHSLNTNNINLTAPPVLIRTEMTHFLLPTACSVAAFIVELIVFWILSLHNWFFKIIITKTKMIFTKFLIFERKINIGTVLDQ